jgi:hypothetical protein
MPIDMDLNIHVHVYLSEIFRGHLMASRSHVTWATQFNVTWGSEMTRRKGPWLLGLNMD